VSAIPQRRLRSGLAIPSLFALAALVTFIGLGSWQLHRKAWKETLIDTLEQRLSATAVAGPPRERWDGLDPQEHEFRRVKFLAAFPPGEHALVYAGASALRSDVSGPGYWVFAPARSATGAVIVVNRGFVPEGRQDVATRAVGESSGSIELIGVMRWPERRAWFAPQDSPGHNLWFVRDHLAIARAKGWGEVAPFYIELESPRLSEGLPSPGPLRVNLRNEHLQYAITWYGLAAVFAVMFILWLRGRRMR
jgi:cytochrome oxidase assembly protein ShyY1